MHNLSQKPIQESTRCQVLKIIAVSMGGEGASVFPQEGRCRVQALNTPRVRMMLCAQCQDAATSLKELQENISHKPVDLIRKPVSYVGSG